MDWEQQMYRIARKGAIKAHHQGDVIRPFLPEHTHTRWQRARRYGAAAFTLGLLALSPMPIDSGADLFVPPPDPHAVLTDFIARHQPIPITTDCTAENAIRLTIGAQLRRSATKIRPRSGTI